MNYILVTPSAPRNVSAKFNRNSFDVFWTKVESGNCPVFYTVQYNETILITGTKLLNYNTSANIIVYVRAEVGGRGGNSTNTQKSVSATPSRGRLLCHNLLFGYAYSIYHL